MSHYTYHSLGDHHPPWGPEGGAWWRKDGLWTPNIQGPWYLGYPGPYPWQPGGGDIIIQTPAQTQAQQALQVSRQAVEAAQAAQAAVMRSPSMLESVWNWIRQHPIASAGIVLGAGLALNSRGRIG